MHATSIACWSVLSPPHALPRMPLPAHLYYTRADAVTASVRVQFHMQHAAAMTRLPSFHVHAVGPSLGCSTWGCAASSCMRAPRHSIPPHHAPAAAPAAPHPTGPYPGDGHHRLACHHHTPTCHHSSPAHHRTRTQRPPLAPPAPAPAHSMQPTSCRQRRLLHCTTHCSHPQGRCQPPEPHPG